MVVDEAAQAVEPSSLIPLTLGIKQVDGAIYQAQLAEAGRLESQWLDAVAAETVVEPSSLMPFTPLGHHAGGASTGRLSA